MSSNPDVKNKQKCILWLGSSIGNFSRPDAVGFIKTFADKALRSGSTDFMLIAIDACKDPVRVWHAYNDGQKVTEDFIMNGLENANSILEEKVFIKADWEYVGEYNMDLGGHQAFYKARKDINLGNLFDGTVIKRDEMIWVERSCKYSLKESTQLWEDTYLTEGNRWGTDDGIYSKDFFGVITVMFLTYQIFIWFTSLSFSSPRNQASMPNPHFRLLTSGKNSGLPGISLVLK